tara:strand:+ start:1069 stop:1305 length:237 start_codon:yes stop_codon:yes gene_type:complete
MENNLTNKTWWPITLTVKETEDYTGWKKEHIFSLIKSGELTFMPGISRNRRIPRHQIDELVGLKSGTEEEVTNQFRNL